MGKSRTYRPLSTLALAAAALLGSAAAPRALAQPADQPPVGPPRAKRPTGAEPDPSPAPVALAAIQHLLASRQVPDRLRGVRALSRITNPRSEAILIRLLGADPAVTVRRAALLVLAGRLTAAKLPLLKRRLASEPDPGLRRLLRALVVRLALGPPRKSRQPGPGALEHPPADAPSKSETKPPPRKQKPRSLWGFLSLELGLVWWHHHEPPVLGSAFGSIGLRYRWFEIALGFGSPVWGKWQSRGYYEFFLDLGFCSLRRKWLRLRHQARLGVLFHNPPFEIHRNGFVFHADLCVIGFHLDKGFWVELKPLTIAVAPRDNLSSSVGLRYEF